VAVDDAGDGSQLATIARCLQEVPMNEKTMAVRVEINKAYDALSRAVDGLDRSEVGGTGKDYSIDQITKAGEYVKAALVAATALAETESNHASDFSDSTAVG
jgi:hypothetical protein